MRTMGIDSSTTSTGWAVLEDSEIVASGVIRPKGNVIDRILKITSEICKLYDEYKPDCVNIEDLSVTRNAQTMKALSGLLYTILAQLYSKDAIITVLKPSQWRKGKIKGRNREELKQSAISYVRENYGLYAEEDTAEAIIIAEWEE